MKVVLFCGGYGMRMRDGQSDVPKPMTTVGPRPLIWHVMRYYAHFGHTDFVLCLGYGAHHVKDYFLNYAETESNDFVLRGGQVELLGSDVQDWTITFVHTGLDSPIGERLRRVRRYVEDEEIFLANYADVLTDVPLNDMIDEFKASDAVGSLVAVPPQSAFHCVEVDDDGELTGDPLAAAAAAVGERRLLRAAPGDLRPPARERRPDRRRLHAAGRAGPDARLPAPRLLAPGGHGQGAHRAGGATTAPAAARGCSGRPQAAAATRCSPTIAGLGATEHER